MGKIMPRQSTIESTHLPMSSLSFLKFRRIISHLGTSCGHSHDLSTIGAACFHHRRCRRLSDKIRRAKGHFVPAEFSSGWWQGNMYWAENSTHTSYSCYDCGHTVTDTWERQRFSVRLHLFDNIWGGKNPLNPFGTTRLWLEKKNKQFGGYIYWFDAETLSTMGCLLPRLFGILFWGVHVKCGGQ